MVAGVHEWGSASVAALFACSSNSELKDEEMQPRRESQLQPRAGQPVRSLRRLEKSDSQGVRMVGWGMKSEGMVPKVRKEEKRLLPRGLASGEQLCWFV